MAVIHIELDIDSDVQPELHEVLSRIGNDASRHERLRQLAAAALIYEGLRLQTQPRAEASVAAVSPEAPGSIDVASAPSSEGARAARIPVLRDVVVLRATQVLPQAAQPATRPRLMRMREKGLFKNG